MIVLRKLFARKDYEGLSEAERIVMKRKRDNQAKIQRTINRKTKEGLAKLKLKPGTIPYKIAINRINDSYLQSNEWIKRDLRRDIKKSKLLRKEINDVEKSLGLPLSKVKKQSNKDVVKGILKSAKSLVTPSSIKQSAESLAKSQIKRLIK